MNNIEYLVKKDFEGRLFVIENINVNNILNIPKDSVIYLKNPSADVILIIDKIKGIIVDKGGKLSHFVIVCAENNIPVVKYNNIDILKQGDYIIIKDGKIYVK